MRCNIGASALWLGLIVALAVSPAVATEYVPTWFGDPDTTFQKWTFDDNTNNPVYADLFSNPGGLAEAYITPAGGQDWIPVYGGEDGIWPMSGFGDWTIPNIQVMDKWILIGGRWRPTPPYYDPWIPQPWFEVKLDSGVFEPYTASLIQNEDLGTGWYDVAFMVEIHNSTPFTAETIRFGGDIYIDTVRIDTASIPEPTSLGLLALGGLALLRRKS